MLPLEGVTSDELGAHQRPNPVGARDGIACKAGQEWYHA